MTRFRTWLFLFFANPLLLATIVLDTNSTDIHIRAGCQKASGVRFTLNGNDIASSDVFIRIRLSNGISLCQTLVWQHPANQGNPSFNPIYLPMALTGLPGDALAAPAETLTIERWKEGEPEIWLRFGSSSTNWIQTAAGDFVSPSPDRLVFWQFGNSARTSFETFSPHFSDGTGNLAAATRDPQQNEMDSAVSTNLCLDTLESNLAVGGDPNDLTQNAAIDPILFYFPNFGDEVGTALTHLGIPQGQDVPFSMTGEFIVGNGIEVNCGGTILVPGQAVADLNALHPELIGLTNQAQLQVGCDQGWGIHTKSEIILEAPNGGLAGFLVAVDGDGNPVDYATVDPSIPPGTAVLLENEVFLIGDPSAPPRAPSASLFPVADGTWLAKTAIVRFEGAGQVPEKTFDVQASVYADRRVSVPPIELGIRLLATNHDSVLDQAPYDGTEQAALCGPDRIEAFIANWAFGTPPASVPTLDATGLILLSALLLWFTLAKSRGAARQRQKPH